MSRSVAIVDHVHLRVADLAASRRFYRAALTALGREIEESDLHLACGELWLDAAAAAPIAPVSRVHLAFVADDRAGVERFHAAAVAAGGRDNGAPGERNYHPGYYAAFVLDPDGNNIEAVHQGMKDR
jgi:catechol 2,3-dioxygenase-like lactoylglutathione lyase family enzyme